MLIPSKIKTRIHLYRAEKTFFIFFDFGRIKGNPAFNGYIFVFQGVTTYVTTVFVVYYTLQTTVTPVTPVTPIFHRFLFFLILLLYRCNALLQTKRATRRPPSKSREPRLTAF